MQCTLTIRFKVVEGLAAWPMVHRFSTREQDDRVKESVDGVARLVDGEHNSSPSVGQSVGRQRVNNTGSRWTAVKLESVEYTSFSIINQKLLVLLILLEPFETISLLTLLGDSGGVVNSLDFCPASLKSLGCFYFWCILSSQWKAVTANLRILPCQH